MLRLAGTTKCAEPSFSTGTTPHCTRGQRAAFQLELVNEGFQRRPVDQYRGIASLMRIHLIVPGDTPSIP